MATPQDLAPELHHQDKGPTILAVACTLTTLSTFFVGARLYVRGKILHRIGLDDWLIILSLICGYLMLGLTIAAVKAGNGRHFALLTTEQKQDAILYTLAGFCPGIFSFGIPKLAVVALLTKITNPSRKHKIWLWFMTGGCLFALFGCVIIIYAQCTPSRSQWDFSVPGKCWSKWILIDYAIVVGTLSAMVDLYLAVYPAVILFKLQMNLRKKLALSIALGLGSIATAVAIYKSTRLTALASPDFSYDTSDITVWTSIEGNSIIIAACIPTLQPLFDLVLGRRLFGSTGEGKHGYHDYPSGPGHSGRMELKTIGSSANKHRKMGISDITIGGKDSQESILGSDHQTHNATTRSDGNSAHDQETWIRRTNDVTVVYEEATAEDQKVRERGGV